MNLTWLSARGIRPEYFLAPLVVLAAAAVSIGDWVWPVALLLWLSIAVARPEPQVAPGTDRLLELGARGSVATGALRLLVGLLTGAPLWGHLPAAVTVLCALLIVLFLLPGRFLTERVEEQQTASVFVRNLPSIEREGRSTDSRLRILASGWPLVVPQGLLILTLVVPPNSAAVWLIAIASLAAAVWLTGYLWFVSRTEGAATRRLRMRLIEHDLLEYSPTVALYSGGGDISSLYQLSVWLPVLEKLDERVVIVTRSQEHFDALGETTVPVICVKRATDFMTLDFGSIRAALYVANTGDVIHFIREPNIMSAFIGHGDSDKSASSNPFAKVYDEIWVAGEAGADRYRRADVGVRDDQFVYVGRPQLDGIQVQAALDSRPTAGGAAKTVLYAPTWEGWEAGQEYCSVHQAGVELVRALLQADEPVRIVYKSHPFAGRRLHSVTAAHREIERLLSHANEQITEPGRRHVLADRSAAQLYHWFDQADFLVTDISSVLSDFVVSEKPYGVYNPTSRDSAAFVEEFPSASAGFVFGAGVDSVARLQQYIVDPGTYADVDARRKLRTYLLGDASSSATAKFNQATSELVAKAEARIQAREADRA